MNSNNELNVDVEEQDKILKSGNTTQERNVMHISILAGEPTEEFQDATAEEPEPQYVTDFEDTFITTHQELADTFGNNSVILEGNTYVKIPAVYRGFNFSDWTQVLYDS